MAGFPHLNPREEQTTSRLLRKIKYNVTCERSNEEYRDMGIPLGGAFNDPWPPKLGLSLAAFADTLTGKVVKITHGNTLYVLDANYQQHKIRLAGIDAPNTSRRMDWLTGTKVRSVAREQSQSAVGISVLSRSPSNPRPIAMTASLLGHRSTRSGQDCSGSATWGS